MLLPAAVKVPVVCAANLASSTALSANTRDTARSRVNEQTKLHTSNPVSSRFLHLQTHPPQVKAERSVHVHFASEHSARARLMHKRCRVVQLVVAYACFNLNLEPTASDVLWCDESVP